MRRTCLRTVLISSTLLSAHGDEFAFAYPMFQKKFYRTKCPTQRRQEWLKSRKGWFGQRLKFLNPIFRERIFEFFEQIFAIIFFPEHARKDDLLDDGLRQLFTKVFRQPLLLEHK